ncbi:ABC transporter permease [Phytohabitans sp. ZYX-F-186]|uniref:ABC transporter permease n=1 Tax=Phytohabitans maris TaxID=3071409 RepID=A0ABU0ZT05_9ACTN|nr:ABC transporter permease [Phytohabitans sp. ZYX-F-186]
MAGYVVRRVIGSFVVLLAVATLVFVLVDFAPGDPARIYAGADATEEDVAAIRTLMGLDGSLPERYLTYLSNAITGDLGQSIFTGRDVLTEVVERAPATLELAIVALIVATPIGIALGRLAGARYGSKLDTAVRVGTLVSFSIPGFWLALLLLFLFGLYLPGIVPTGGWVPLTEDPWGNVQHMILPVLVLALPYVAMIARTLRVSMLDALGRDYVMFARAMSLSPREVNGQVALPNAIIPTATVIGLALAYLIGGTVIVEVVFTIPGIGQLMIDSFEKQDFPLAIGCTLFIALFCVVLNLVVDLLYAVINPRVRELYRQRVSVRDL